MGVWLGPMAGSTRTITAADIQYSGTMLFAQSGKYWELALLDGDAATLRFLKNPGLVDLFFVAGGEPGQHGSGDSAYAHTAIGGRGGNGGECKTVEGVRLRSGVDYAVTIGGSGEGTTFAGDGLQYEAESGAGSLGGRTGGAYANGAAGADGVYAYGKETDSVLISSFVGHRFGSGGAQGGNSNLTGANSGTIRPTEGGLGGESNGPNHEYGKGGGNSQANGSAGYANHGQGGGGSYRYYYGNPDRTSNSNPGAGGSGVVFIRGHIA